jgi:hypothetical protein
MTPATPAARPSRRGRGGCRRQKRPQTASAWFAARSTSCTTSASTAALLAAGPSCASASPPIRPGPLAEANVYQTMMRDYRVRDHEPEFLAALAEARRLADLGRARAPGRRVLLRERHRAGATWRSTTRAAGAGWPALKHGLRCLGDMERAAKLDPAFVDPLLPDGAPRLLEEPHAGLPVRRDGAPARSRGWSACGVKAAT